ncbi:TatD family hydrolase [Acetobacter fallax]|uniref:YchF/TatD family DNA exonuclease n=1 Tax=Acetobacter fallax TaxID=1737473 RepID=A0ABX0K729_9PROT|nr:TatD family hydrolase [Acetobacter fallax]NHO31023.1 YchF/TatD family DNA exonuclease [Acetobacter fallax]NHO34580.1 YchF/TatD family DNA exonuclease [Acetobacter fallax]
MTGLIDTHCHLDHFSDEEMPDVLNRAREFGLDGMVTIGTRLSKQAEQKALTKYSRPDLTIWCAIGTHPDHVDEEGVPEAETIVALTEEPEVIAIGESGLDYFHGGEDIRPTQQASFRAHIHAARLTGLPLAIHARQADDDIAVILREETEERGAFPFLLHCFASGPALAKAALDLGGYLSFSGIVTFPRSTELREIAAQVPMERVLVETDSPFLAPVPRRGKRNEPGYTAYTAGVVAELHGLELPALAEATTANFHRLFTKAG